MSAANEFSVCQFFPGGSYDYDVRFVSAEEAMKRFAALTRSVGARIGTTERVIITDGGDSCVMEWVRGKGIVWGLPGMAKPAEESP